MADTFQHMVGVIRKIFVPGWDKDRQWSFVKRPVGSLGRVTFEDKTIAAPGYDGDSDQFTADVLALICYARAAGKHKIHCT